MANQCAPKMETKDHGPVYKETSLTRTIAEPFNAISAIPFLLLALYWIRKLRGTSVPVAFKISLWLLAIGGIGGAIYHAFRASPIFLFLDFVPIVLCGLILNAYLWKEISPKKGLWIFLANIVTLIVLREALAPHLSTFVMINIGYLLVAALILTPLLIRGSRTGYANFSYILAACCFFTAAILCRMFDHDSGLPMGSHWLWHLFSLASVGCLIKYLQPDPIS